MEVINTLIILFLVVMGLSLGSFLNVVIFRKGTGLSLGGRSMCFSCGKTLVWYELIPLVSFVIQKGRCRSCKSKLSWQYPIVESISALAVVWLGYMWLIQNDPTLFNLGFFILSVSVSFSLIAIAVYDLRHMIIPDTFSLWFSLSALALLGISYWSFKVDPLSAQTMMTGESALWFIGTGLAFALFFFLIWLLSRGKWIGFGDVKLVAGIGFFLGPVGGVNAMVFAFWVGALYALFHLAISTWRKKMGKGGLSHEVPFAPFLIAGVILAYSLNVDIMQIGFLIEYVKQVFFV